VPGPTLIFEIRQSETKHHRFFFFPEIHTVYLSVAKFNAVRAD